MSDQHPKWKFVDNFGDADPINNGGLFLFVDRTGRYDPEVEVLEEPSEDAEDEKWTVYRVELPRMFVKSEVEPWDKTLSEKDDGSCRRVFQQLVNEHGHAEWFCSHIASAARTVGSEPGVLWAGFCSEDPSQRLGAYRDIASEWGWHEFDHDPLILTRAEVMKRYKSVFATMRRRRRRG